MGRNAMMMTAALTTLLLGTKAHAFDPKVTVQAYIKSGSAGYNASGRTGRIVINKGVTPVWCTVYNSSMNITNGVFSQEISGNGTACSGVTGTPFTGVTLTQALAGSTSSDAFTADITIDLSNDGIGTGTDATFTGIPINAVPFAMVAQNLVPNGATNGQYLKYNSGTSLWVPATLSVSSSDLTAGAVDTTALGSGAVTSAKIAAGAVDTAALGSGAVTSAKITAGAVDTAALGSGAVTTAKLAAGAVDTAALGAGAVTSAKFAAGAVDATALGSGAVTMAKISGTGASSGDYLKYNGSAWAPTALSISSTDFTAGAVDTAALAAGSVTSAKFAAGAVDTTALASGAVTSSKLAAGAVDATALASGAVTTAKFAAGAVDTAALGSGAVTAAKMAASSVDLTTTTVTGALPIANGGTNNASLAVTNGGVVYTDGTKLVNSGVGTSGQFLTSGGSGAPTWSSPTTLGSSAIMSIFEEFLMGPGSAVTTTSVSNAYINFTNYSAFSTAAGTVISSTAVSAGNENHPGILRIAVNNTSGGIAFCPVSSTAGAVSAGSLNLTGGAVTMEAMVRVTTLAANATYRLGMGTGTVGSAAPTKGLWFEFVGAATGQWKTQATGTVAQGATNTGNTFSAGAWTKLNITVNAAGSSVTFQKDSDTASTNSTSTNIPANTDILCPFVSIQGTGATALSMDIDYVKITKTFSTAR